jgi:very-short-patch-repair endonuclease
VIQRHPDRHGAKSLADALEHHTPDDPRLRSTLEQTFLALVRTAGLPEPQCNVYVDGLLVDFYWPDADLVVEVDGYTYHRGRRSFEDDRRRDAIHTVAGRRTLRLTPRRIERESGSVFDDISRLLAGAGPKPAPPLQRPAVRR